MSKMVMTAASYSRPDDENTGGEDCAKPGRPRRGHHIIVPGSEPNSSSAIVLRTSARMPHTLPRSVQRRSLPFDPLGSELRFSSMRVDLIMNLAGCYVLFYFFYQRRTDLDEWKGLVNRLSQENRNVIQENRNLRRHIQNIQNTRQGRLYQLIGHEDMVEVPRRDVIEMNKALAHYHQEVCELKEQKRQLEEECRGLASRIERVESLHAQQFQADSGSYQDSTPTPPLLQAAADAAKDAIISCASDLCTAVKRLSISINLQHFIPNYKPPPYVDPQEFSKPTFIKKAFQDYFLNLFFRGFESATFSFESDGIPQFQKPENHKKELFQEYKDCRYNEPEKMLTEDAQFREFVDGKVSFPIGGSSVMMGDPNEACGLLQDVLHDPKSRFNKSFLRLARAVWALHKLAFAFEPSAEIFRVGHGSTFDEDYMEDMRQADEDEGDDTPINPRAPKNVDLVCAPGFTVRNSVVKARVWLSELPSHSS